MASSPAPDDDVERCTMAFEALGEVALEQCGDADTMQKALAQFVGVEPDVNCDASLREGLEETTCGDFRGLRQWVMCRAWQLIDEDEAVFSNALDQAWSEARDACEDLGMTV